MRLRELRNKSGLTQNEIASKLKVSGQTILNWENGIYEPKINQLIELADLFNVSIDYLVERKNNEKTINDICKELEKISKEEMISFIRQSLMNK
ncbi:MAG: helix-turn-helix transcriptional regulator [Erysipelotrichaceae bacterium]|nr:helix-turn-helix transcriptional regulator [Erysipelotrichaceae bacterium]